ncbi:HlyD family secretion protein [Candidatus Odyssella acanthamoebae]|uniref:HlyD family secretion protein n=1 Tax=Candidatus Odyssella acanthamoebae TaxID=91604 RepID=UPI0006921BAD|nr:HlyD family secretion protein [Candidatus Paracaedibacter acanthamoebae]
MIAGFIGALALIVVVAWYVQLGKESTDDATLEAHTIPICPKVPGYIATLHVKDNQHVKKGDLLVEIDPLDYQLRVESAKANLASAEVSAKNAVVNAKRQLAIGKAAGTQKEIDNALTAEATAKAAVDSVKAQLSIAEKDLADTQIIAPEDGVVTMRTAEQGAYVTTGKQLFMIVGRERWVVANFKETQLTDMRAGQKVNIEIDAYPDLKLEGLVDSIQNGTGARFSAFPPENATGNFVKIVQRVPVKITFKQPELEGITLGPGLSVYPTVYTKKSK